MRIVPRLHKGWLRLWIVATVIGVPVGTIWDASADQAVWNAISHGQVDNCVYDQTTLSTHPDSIECAHRVHAYEPAFMREHTTVGAYWGGRLIGYFILDCILTLLLIGAAFVGRWVYRGFRPPAA